MTWSTLLPGYDNNNPLTIHASVLSSNGCRSSMTMVGMTNPTVCVTPPPPWVTSHYQQYLCQLYIKWWQYSHRVQFQGTRRHLEFSINNGMTWSSSLPMYDVNNALTIHAVFLSPEDAGVWWHKWEWRLPALRSCCNHWQAIVILRLKLPWLLSSLAKP